MSFLLTLHKPLKLPDYVRQIPEIFRNNLDLGSKPTQSPWNKSAQIGSDLGFSCLSEHPTAGSDQPRPLSFAERDFGCSYRYVYTSPGVGLPSKDFTALRLQETDSMSFTHYKEIPADLVRCSHLKNSSESA
jgi:hypothetical protein